MGLVLKAAFHLQGLPRHSGRSGRHGKRPGIQPWSADRSRLRAWVGLFVDWDLGGPEVPEAPLAALDEGLCESRA